MNFTIGLKKNFNDTEVEPVWLARGQVTLQISPINFFSLASLAWMVKKIQKFSSTRPTKQQKRFL